MKNIGVTNNRPPSPFTKGGIITPPFSKGRLGGIFLLTNPKGISVLFLVIAMMLMVTIGYVFSYLIPTKQKTSSFPIHSIKAFFLAQSGIEFAVRYSVAAWGANATPAELNGLDNLTRNLGDRGGYFILNYDRPTNKLTSRGVIPNGGERRIVVSNFTSFLRAPNGLILDPRRPAPCWNSSTRRAQFYIVNATETSLTLDSFRAWWTGGNAHLTAIYMGGSLQYSGNSYDSSDNREDFNQGTGSQTITSDQTILVEINWNGNMTETGIYVRFYTITGDYYLFYLDPAATGLGSC